MFSERQAGMRHRIDVITLAVDDLDRALEFYGEGLGLQSSGITATEFTDEVSTASGAVVMFELEGRLTLALYPRTELAKDARVAVRPAGPGDFSIGHLVGSKDEVDALLDRAQAAGANVDEPARERPWGIYSGYFRDPDGHLWEIICNPAGTLP